YTTTEPEARSPVPGIGAVRMLDFIEDHLESIPPVRGDSKLTLQDIVGADGASEIEAAGSLIFHSVGDTGKGSHTQQEAVANAMASDYSPTTNPSRSPAFLFHLGDVNYYNNTPIGYYQQFYNPYKHYPGKIIA